MDGYKGHAKLYAPEQGGVPRLREAACRAHLWRDFHDFWASTKSEIARKAIGQIGKLYDIERDIKGQPADVRHAARQKLSQSKVTAFFARPEEKPFSARKRNAQWFLRRVLDRRQSRISPFNRIQPQLGRGVRTIATQCPDN
jgi:hypothetical protein